MKAYVLFFICCCNSYFTQAQPNKMVRQLVSEGVVLHDKGDYNAAIHKYDSALTLAKDDFYANYEKSLSCLYLKRYDDCIQISKFLVTSHIDNPEMAGVYCNYGSALDYKNLTAEAIRIYDEGIKKFPDAYLLYFNKGLTFAGIEQWKDALQSFYSTIRIKPTHAGASYYSCLLLAKTNHIAAFISGLLFLAAEPEGKRALKIVGKLNNLTDSFTQFAGKKALAADSVEKKKGDNDFSEVERMLANELVATNAGAPSPDSSVEKINTNIQLLVKALSANLVGSKGVIWEFYVPFLIEMNNKGLVPVYAHLAAITAGEDANIKWINDHPDKLEIFYKWYNNYQWPTKK